MPGLGYMGMAYGPISPAWAFRGETSPDPKYGLIMNYGQPYLQYFVSFRRNILVQDRNFCIPHLYLMPTLKAMASELKKMFTTEKY